MTTASPAAPIARTPRRRDDAPIGWVATAVVLIFCALMLCVPWEQLWGGSFVDRAVYLDKFAGLHPQAARAYTGSARAFITDEILWDMLVRWVIEGLRIPIEVLFGAISFLCLYVFSRYLASKHGLLSLIFLVNPLVVPFAFSQLRLAFATSLLMLAMFYRARRVLAVGLMVLACCIHTATFLILFIFFAGKELMARLSGGRFRGVACWLGLTVLGAMVVAVIGPFRGGILTAVGDRRAVYDNVAVSFTYSSFWILLYLMTATQPKKYFGVEGNSIAVAFLSIFVLAEFFNVYNLRFLSVAYPLIISSMLNMGRAKRLLMLSVYFVYAAVQWHYWLAAGLAP